MLEWIKRIKERMMLTCKIAVVATRGARKETRKRKCRRLDEFFPIYIHSAAIYLIPCSCKLQICESRVCLPREQGHLSKYLHQFVPSNIRKS